MLPISSSEKGLGIESRKMLVRQHHQPVLSLLKRYGFKQCRHLVFQAKKTIVEKLIKKLTATQMETKPVEKNQVIHISYDLSKNNVMQLMQLFLAKNQGLLKADLPVNEQSELEQAMTLMEELLKEVELRLK